MNYLVTGYARSGTSMMMRCLEKGGIEVVADKEHPEYGVGTQLNVHGCYEPNRVTVTYGDIFNAPGKAVKCDLDRLNAMPNNAEYSVVFMLRNSESIYNSIMYQRSVTLKRIEAKEDYQAAHETLEERAEKELWSANRVRRPEMYYFMMGHKIHMLSEKPNVKVVCLDYDRVLKHSEVELKKLYDAGWSIDVAEAIKGVEQGVKRF